MQPRANSKCEGAADNTGSVRWSSGDSKSCGYRDFVLGYCSLSQCHPKKKDTFRRVALAERAREDTSIGQVTSSRVEPVFVQPRASSKSEESASVLPTVHSIPIRRSVSRYLGFKISDPRPLGTLIQIDFRHDDISPLLGQCDWVTRVIEYG